MMQVRTMAAGAALGLSILLAGCFELTKDAAFRENGEARVEVELALAAEVVALASNPAFAKQTGGGVPNPFGACGKPWPANEPLPDGVRSVESKRGKRGEMETCTMIFDVSDPIAAVESAKKVEVPNADAVPKQDVSLTRLPGSSGYRLRMVTTPANRPEVPPEAAKMAAALMAAMFANRYITLSISGKRIENTNGERSEDKRKVMWRLPIVSLVAPNPEKPVSIEADIIYR